MANRSTYLAEAFGFQLKHKPAESLETFTLSRDQLADGLALDQTGAGGVAALSFQASQVPEDERQLINSYRSMVMNSKIDEALQEIRNEIFIFDVPGERAFELAFTEEDGAPEESIQEEIIEAFRDLYEITEFRSKGAQYFDDWYVDSRLFFHKVIDGSNTKEGIKKIVQIDPLKIRRVRIIPQRDVKTGVIDLSKIKELYVYGDQFPTTYQAGWSGVMDISYGTQIQGLQIEPDSICAVESGCFDRTIGRYVGYLKKAILPFNNLRMMEDAMLIFRVVRAPMRRAIYIDVSSLQKNKAEEYMKSMMSRFKNKMIYDSNTGSLSDRRNIMSMMEDYWLPRRCLALNTKIQLLDGRSVELSELIKEHKEGKKNWAYSVSPEGRVVPGLISWAGITQRNAKVVDVYLDNGEVVTVTPDHPFISRSGSLIEAKDLQLGTSLMPFNRRMSEPRFKQNGQRSYEQIQMMDDESWVNTHQSIKKFVDRDYKKDEVIHHSDFNRFNNNPENLVYMDRVEHLKLHALAGQSSWAKSDRNLHIQRLRESAHQFYSTEAGLGRRQLQSEINRSNPAIEQGFANARQKVKELRAHDKATMDHDDYIRKWSPGLENMLARISTDEHKNTVREGNKKAWLKKFGFIQISDIIKVVSELVRKDITTTNPVLCATVNALYPDQKDVSEIVILRVMRNHGYHSFTDVIARNLGVEFLHPERKREFVKKFNHKVIRVVERDDLMDVGTLTIDENHQYHNYHNFALSCGIFVKNSDGKGTEIQNLEGQDSTGILDEVNYYKNELYRSLNVPISRFADQPETFVFGKGIEIQRDEYRFKKYIDRLRQNFMLIWDDLLKTHLILKGIISEDEWPEIRRYMFWNYSEDNSFVEYKESELINNRVQILSEVDPFVGKYFSKEWVRRKILKQDDDEFNQENKTMASEYKDDQKTAQNEFRAQKKIEAEFDPDQGNTDEE